MRLFALFFILVLSGSCKNRKVDHVLKSAYEGEHYSVDKIYEKVYGPVKTLTEENYTPLENADTPGKVLEKLNYTIVYSFDKNGNETGIVSVNENGKLKWKTKQVYDGNNISKIEYYNADNQLRHIFKYAYDRNNRLQSFTDHDMAEAKGDFKYVYTTNSEGVIEEERIFNHNGNVTTTTTMKWDKNGNLTEMVVYSIPKRFEFSTYDDSDRLITSTTQVANNTANRYAYEYYFRDPFNNWGLRITKLNDSIISSVTKRRIEYY